MAKCDVGKKDIVNLKSNDLVEGDKTVKNIRCYGQAKINSIRSRNFMIMGKKEIRCSKWNDFQLKHRADHDSKNVYCCLKSKICRYAGVCSWVKL